MTKTILLTLVLTLTALKTLAAPLTCAVLKENPEKKGEYTKMLWMGQVSPNEVPDKDRAFNLFITKDGRALTPDDLKAMAEKIKRPEDVVPYQQLVDSSTLFIVGAVDTPAGALYLSLAKVSKDGHGKGVHAIGAGRYVSLIDSYRGFSVSCTTK